MCEENIPESLRELLDYNPETGRLYWRSKPSRRVHAGAEAGSMCPRGYMYVTYKKRNYMAHRIAWWLTHNADPPELVDHINGVTCDNRLCNLRLASPSENMHNQRGPSKNSKTGVLGVVLTKYGTYAANIGVKGKTKYLGRFSTIEDAAAAYAAAKALYHPTAP